MNARYAWYIAGLLGAFWTPQSIAFSSKPLPLHTNQLSQWAVEKSSNTSPLLSIRAATTRRYQSVDLEVLQNPIRDEVDSYVDDDITDEVIPTTLPGAIRRFFFGKECGPLLITASLAAALVWRIQLGSDAAEIVLDLTVFVSMVVFWWFQEHEMHLHLLHSKFDWLGKRIHEEHHEKPYFHISIDPAGLMIGWLAAIHILLRCVLPLPLALSATLGYGLSGLWYEWAHYIVHTKVRPRSRFWKQMRDHHIHHHLVDDRYWLGFSAPAIDDFFGTNPSIQDVKREQKRAREMA